MKKIILSLIMLCGFVFASDIIGTIQSIDQRNKTITVNNTLIQIQPYTKIEKDTCWGFDTSSSFKALKVGDIVEIDIQYYQDILMAEEIEIECGSDRAY